jgi:hypothetical protein
MRDTSWFAHNVNWGLEFDPEKIKIMCAKVLSLPPDLHPGTRNGIVRAIMSGDYDRADQYIQRALVEKKDAPTA